ncbi:MAG: CvpA family protein [Candidatus Limnocylindrales bacterium]
MNLVGAIQSAPLADLAILLGLFAFVFIGVLEGAIRRLIGIAAILFAFLFAANLRDPVGSFLAQNWTQWDLGYNRLLAFVIIFVVLAVGASIATQGFYKRTNLLPDRPMVDDVVGGVLGLLEGVLLLMLLVVIFNSNILPAAGPGDLTLLRWGQDLIVSQSHIASGIKSGLVPAFIHLLSGLLPSDLVSVFP